MMDYIKIVKAQDSQGKNHDVKLKIWDADEESIKNHLEHLYLKDANCIVLCYAINDRKSFDQLSSSFNRLLHTK